MLELHPLQPRDLVGLLLGDEREVERRMPCVHGLALPGLAQLAGRVLADRLEQAVACLPGPARDVDERTVDEPSEEVEHVGAVDIGARGDGLTGAQRERAAEYREAAEHGLLAGVEHPVAPVERRRERAVTRGRRSVLLAEQAAVVQQPLGDLVGGQQRHARRGQLDGQRDAVEPPADPDHRRARAGQRERGIGATGALGEQLDGAVLAARRVGRGDREAVHAPHLLAGDAQRLAAGREDRQ